MEVEVEQRLGDLSQRSDAGVCGAQRTRLVISASEAARRAPMASEFREHSRLPYPVLEHLRGGRSHRSSEYSINSGVQLCRCTQVTTQTATCEGISRKSRSTSKAESSLYSGREHSTCITCPNSWKSVRTSVCERSDGVGGSDAGFGRGKLASIAATGSWRDPSGSLSEFCAISTFKLQYSNEPSAPPACC